ncbi:MAG: ABC transporter permease [Coprobacillaceae bacterium]
MKNRDALKSLLSSLIAIGCGLLFGLIIIFIANSDQALKGFSILLQGGFYKGIKSTGQVLYLAVPIMMTGLSVAFAFKCGLFNIGTPGQYIVGAFTAICIALNCDFIPNSVLWIVCLIAGGLAGALWAVIPGILKAYKNVNIVISCIMMNYIGMLLVIEGVKKFIYNPMGAESYSVPIAKAIPKAGLDVIFDGASINLGTIIAIGLCILAYIIMNKTTFGYELKACGYNSDASRYAGMNEKKCVILSMAIAGFFAGIGGAILYMSGTGATIATAESLAAEGFNGIPVALLGFNNPLGVIASAIFIAYINLGGNYMQSVNIAVEIIDIIVASIIYFSSFTLFIKLFLDRRRSKKEVNVTDGGDE